MNLKLHVWRQKGPEDKGQFETYEANNILEDMSFLEMLDVVNERLESEGREPIAFESDSVFLFEGILAMQRKFVESQTNFGIS